LYLLEVDRELKVAVVIPTFNRRDLVTQAVRSVLGQTYTDLSCLVIDNGSTDGTGEALAAIGDSRLKVLVEGRPMGGPGARNLGITAAEGSEWVAFLDSDDVWAPTKLERQMAAIARYPEARWSATACVSVGEDLRVRHAVRMRDVPAASSESAIVSSAEVRALLLEDNRVPAGNSTVLAARAVLQEVGGFDAALATCDDWDLWLRIAALSPLAYIDAPLAAYRLWDGQSSSNERAFMRDAATVRGRNFVDAGPVPRSFFARWEREAARRHVAARRRLPAARSYIRAAWVGAAPGQLAYAAAAVALPGVAERRLRRLEAAQRLPEGWEPETEPWLAPYRTANNVKGNNVNDSNVN
jgi:glycosyltransferase involved in cell wall biosynthesis